MREVNVSKGDSGIRLDKFLFKIMPDAPCSVVYKSLRKKRVKVNGKRVTSGTQILKTGDALELYFNDEFFESDITKPWENCKGDIDIVYMDENIAVLNKKSGQPSQDMPGEEGNSLESEFRAYLYKKGELSRGAYIPSLCHRIDRNTSGLVIAAKNITAHRIIAEKIRNKEIRKFYICEVEGRIRPQCKSVRGYITRTAENKVKFSLEKTKRGKESNLNYSVLRYDGENTIAEVELLSGRTHQIRATMSYLGHPIAGDIKYGALHRNSKYQNLTAYKIIFDFTTDADELNYLKGKIVEIDYCLQAVHKPFNSCNSSGN